VPATNINGSAATVVVYPATSGNPHAVIFNTGGQPAYLGQSLVTSADGLVLAPGNHIELPNNAGTVFGIAGFNQIAPFGTANAVTTIGGSTITLASGGTAFTSGMTIVIEPASARQEIAMVFASNAGTVTTAAPMTFVHGTAVTAATTFSQITPLVTTIRAERGAS
jgi:hypothetical protein